MIIIKKHSLIKQEKQKIKIPQIYFDRNRNELRYNKFYPNIPRYKYSSTYITMNCAKVSNEYSEKNNNDNIFENNDFHKLYPKEYLYANPTFEAHRKGKIDKTNGRKGQKHGKIHMRKT